MVFFSCEIGQRLCIAYEELDDKIGQFKWYSFPTEIQRILLILMINTQQPVEVLCFGSTACNRETFKKVCFAKKNHKNERLYVILTFPPFSGD